MKTPGDVQKTLMECGLSDLLNMLPGVDQGQAIEAFAQRLHQRMEASLRAERGIGVQIRRSLVAEIVLQRAHLRSLGCDETHFAKFRQTIVVDDEVVEAIFKSIDPETKHALVLHAVCSTGCKDEVGPVPVSYHLTRAQAERELEAHRQAMFEYEREQFNIAQDMKLNPMDPKERFKLFYEFAIREVVVQRPDDGDYSPFIAPRD